MTHRLITYVAETHVHPGEGEEGGIVDRPVARESVSGLQFVPGHSHKGAVKANINLRLEVLTTEDHDGVKAISGAIEIIFGDSKDFGAGALLVGDARLVLMPFRARGLPFVLTTSPYVLSRLARDLDLASRNADANRLRDMIEKLPDLRSETAIRPASINEIHGYKFMLPELEDDETPAESLRQELAKLLKELLALPDFLEIEQFLAVLDDTAFRYLCDIGLPVRARNKLSVYKQSENLWYEETLPPDTVMVTLLGHRGLIKVDDDGDDLDVSPVDLVLEALECGEKGLRYLQVGGNETVGQGIFQIFVHGEGMSSGKKQAETQS